MSVEQAYKEIMSRPNPVRDLVKKIDPEATFKFGAWCTMTPKEENETVASAQAKIGDKLAEHGYHPTFDNLFQRADGHQVSVASIVQSGQNLHLISKVQ